MNTDTVLPKEENGQKLQFRTADALVGHILFERFLIESDLSNTTAADDWDVYLAKDLRHFCRKVVIKALPVEKPNAFQDVCDALMKLEHPNIEWILETGKLFDGRPYAVTTYTSGETLSQLTYKGRRLTLDRAAHIIESVAEGLAAAHARGIFHFHVTPANIVVTPQQHEEENVRLTGFGSAWPEHLTGEPLLYTAPELMEDDARATAASDIYSLAATAYRMLTGDVPFKGVDRQGVLDSIVRGVSIRPSVLRTDLRPDAEALLLSALQYKPLMRPRDARAFGRELADELRAGIHPRKISKPPEVEVPALFFASSKSVADIVVRSDEPLVGTRKRINQNNPPVVPERAIVWWLIVLLPVVALSIPIGQTFLQKEEQKPAAVTSIVQKAADSRVPREIRYLIEDGSSPQLILKNRFGGMTFESDSAGNAYILTESADDLGRTVYSVLYPQSKINGGSPHIEAKQPARTRDFTSNDDPERIWLVWTASKQDDLESARQGALHADGVVRDENDVQKIRHFLERNKNNKLDIGHDDATRQTVLRGSGERIVYRILRGDN